MIKLIARVVEVWVTLGPGPPCPGDLTPPAAPRSVVLLRRALGAALPAPGGWAAVVAWHLARAAGRRLVRQAARPRPGRHPHDPHA